MRVKRQKRVEQAPKDEPAWWLGVGTINVEINLDLHIKGCLSFAREKGINALAVQETN